MADSRYTGICGCACGYVQQKDCDTRLFMVTCVRNARAPLFDLSRDEA